MSQAMTHGIHHVGLSVPDLTAAERFFVDALGWRVVGGSPDYPAVFVSDGTVMVTLWRVAEPGRASPFDRRANVGLHHLALRVADRGALRVVHDRLRDWPDVSVEFAPAPMHEGASTHHFICAMPGGVRLEFTAAAA